MVHISIILGLRLFRGHWLGRCSGCGWHTPWNSLNGRTITERLLAMAFTELLGSRSSRNRLCFTAEEDVGIEVVDARLVHHIPRPGLRRLAARVGMDTILFEVDECLHTLCIPFGVTSTKLLRHTKQYPKTWMLLGVSRTQHHQCQQLLPVVTGIMNFFNNEAQHLTKSSPRRKLIVVVACEDAHIIEVSCLTTFRDTLFSSAEEVNQRQICFFLLGLYIAPSLHKTANLANLGNQLPILSDGSKISFIFNQSANLVGKTLEKEKFCHLFSIFNVPFLFMGPLKFID